ncbi:MAG: SRPBCC family protein [Candidatus Rokubacteria bacterium]|nr:SRPBCC family protein [Candidatus Rokubacteria bacterium]
MDRRAPRRPWQAGAGLMVFDEEFEVRADIERVWTFLLDVDRVARCVPGCQGAEPLGEPGTYRARIAVRLGPVAAAFALKVRITEERRPVYLASTVEGHEGGAASTLTQRNELTLAALADGGTRVRFHTEVNVLGRLGKFGAGLLRQTARGMAEEFAARVRARLESVTESPTA